MTLETNMPEVVTEFCYVTNHHYIKLRDKKGNVGILPATGVMRCECTKCAAKFYVEMNSGETWCPHCRSQAIAVWGRIQLAFVPEDESELRYKKVRKK